ncbi:hypothetical protein ACJX0J_007453 [Zea mays]
MSQWIGFQNYTFIIYSFSILSFFVNSSRLISIYGTLLNSCHLLWDPNNLWDSHLLHHVGPADPDPTGYIWLMKISRMNAPERQIDLHNWTQSDDEGASSPDTSKWTYGYIMLCTH